MSYGEELMTEMLIAEALEEQDRKDQVSASMELSAPRCGLPRTGAASAFARWIAVISEIASQCSRGICRFMMSLSIGSP